MDDKVSAKSKAHIRYKLKDRTPVPGVTTIVGLRAKPALIPWANKLGLAGISTDKYVDDKADIGILAHAMCIHDLGGPEPGFTEYSQKQIDQAENSFLSFLEWKKKHTIEPILLEAPMVSERWKFGGTVDVYAKVDREEEVLDIKTGNGIYPEHLIQVVAYATLIEENLPHHRLSSVRILNIPRAETEASDEKTRRWIEMGKQWSIFEHLLAIYFLEKEIKNV